MPSTHATESAHSARATVSFCVGAALFAVAAGARAQGGEGAPTAPTQPPIVEQPGVASPELAQDPTATPPPTDSPVKSPEPAPPKPAEAAPPAPGAVEMVRDDLDAPGYVPGYRPFVGLGTSPYAPRLGAVGSAVTPSFGSVTPAEDWNFTWTGYMSATLIASIGERHYDAVDGQTETVVHTPPQTVDEYASFVGTNPVQGSWVGMNFLYGTDSVTAQVSIATWNPSAPINNYSLGSQYFINDAFLRFRAPVLGGVRLSWNVGYFSTNYGNLGRYGGGLYTNPISGAIQGVGETTIAEYDFSENVIGTFEHGFMGTRNGGVPIDVPATAPNANNNPNWVAAYIHHAHAGVVVKGDLQYQAQLHYLSNFAHDERSQTATDNPVTEAIDESYVRDGNVTVLGFDARVISPIWGYLALGGAYVDADYAYSLRGLQTYGGDGERLAEVWFGDTTTGTGELYVLGLNYSASLGRIVTHPDPFPGNHPDINFDAGCHLAAVSSDEETYDRLRYRCGVNALYTFLSWLGVGARFDHIDPNSNDSRERFQTVAARLQFKTDWNSHEAINLHYVKWFYGSRTRSDNVGPRLNYELDDQVVALNFNMWW